MEVWPFLLRVLFERFRVLQDFCPFLVAILLEKASVKCNTTSDFKSRSNSVLMPDLEACQVFENNGIARV